MERLCWFRAVERVVAELVVKLAEEAVGMLRRLAAWWFP